MMKKYFFTLFFIFFTVLYIQKANAQSLSPTLVNPSDYKKRNDAPETKKTILGILVYENGWYIFYEKGEAGFIPLNKIQLKYNRCFSCEPIATKKSDGNVELLFRYQDQLENFILAVFIKQYTTEER